MKNDNDSSSKSEQEQIEVPVQKEAKTQEQIEEDKKVNGLIGELGGAFKDRFVTLKYYAKEFNPDISKSQPLMNPFIEAEIFPLILSGLFKENELSGLKKSLIAKKEKIKTELSNKEIRNNVNLYIDKFINAIDLGSGENIEKHVMNAKKIEEYKNLSNENKEKLKVSLNEGLDTFSKFCIEENNKTIQELTINKIVSQACIYKLINNDSSQALKEKLNKYPHLFELNETNYEKKFEIISSNYLKSINIKDLDGISNQILSVFSNDEQKQQILKDRIDKHLDNNSITTEKLKDQINNDIKNIYSVKLKDINHTKLSDFDKKLDEVIEKGGNINHDNIKSKNFASRIIQKVTEFLTDFFKSKEEKIEKAQNKKIEQVAALIGKDVKKSLRDIKSDMGIYEGPKKNIPIAEKFQKKDKSKKPSVEIEMGRM